ncbi:MAG TPA: tetratricopeptide repeat protein, partial [Rhizomicrobium sp.]|nr:tetratricopeptide repeat protein [Rhizomicrobium sp.]
MRSYFHLRIVGRRGRMRRALLAIPMLAALVVPGICASYDDLNRGIQARNAEDWQSAIVAFGNALAANDLPAGLQYVAHIDRGEAHLNLQQLDLAMADYAAALVLRPDDIQAMFGRSRVRFLAKAFDQSASDLDDLVAAHPFNSQLYFYRAEVRAARGQYNKGLQDLSVVRSEYPTAINLYRPIGIAYWEVGQIADAETNFSAAVDKDKDVYAWLWLALTEARLGKAVSRMDIRDFDKTKWPGPIVDFFQGNATPDAVFASANQGDEKSVRGQICEANFYVGEWLLQHRDTAGTKLLLQRAVSNCPVNH